MSLCMATYRGIPSVPHYGVLTVACGRLPGKGLPSTGILLRRSKPAGIYLFTLTFPPSLLVSLIPEVLRLLTRGIPVSGWFHIRPHQVTGVLLTRSRQCRILMSRTHRRNVWVCGPRVCQKGTSTSQRRYSDGVVFQHVLVPLKQAGSLRAAGSA